MTPARGAPPAPKIKGSRAEVLGEYPFPLVADLSPILQHPPSRLDAPKTPQATDSAGPAGYPQEMNTVMYQPGVLAGPTSTTIGLAAVVTAVAVLDRLPWSK
jgi:hypothetical protein